MGSVFLEASDYQAAHRGSLWVADSTSAFSFVSYLSN